jgi:hypothetical protein
VQTNPVVAQAQPAAQSGLDNDAKADYERKIGQMESTIKDLNEKLDTLKLKRAEDREKLREFDKVKIQMQQVINCFTLILFFLSINKCNYFFIVARIQNTSSRNDFEIKQRIAAVQRRNKIDKRVF